MPLSANLRVPLLEITSNRRAGSELSPHIRSTIVGMKIGGQNGSQIARTLNLPQSTVYKTIDLALQRDANQSQSRSGAPAKYTIRDERRLLRFVRLNPKKTWRQVVEAIQLGVSKRTHQRMLNKYHITKWLAKKRPELTPDHAAARLSWAELRSEWTIEQWRQIL
jgi:hypothetical protein